MSIDQEELDELQTDAIEDQEDISESATDTDEDLEEKTDADNDSEETEGDESEGKENEPKKSDNVTKRIHKLHYERKEAERKAAALEKRLEELESAQATVSRPVVPKLPDPYDDNFEQLMAARDAAAAAAMKFDLDQQRVNESKQEKQRQVEEEKQAGLKATIAEYSLRAAKLNVSDKALEIAGRTVHAYELNDLVVEHILTDDQGPLITTYLAKNPDVLEDLADMSPTRAAAFIETKVKPHVGKVKKSTLNKPASTLGGGGVPRKERGPKGAKFE